MTKTMHILMAGLPGYDSRGAGRANAAVLDGDGVRPAFFDVSCLLYRLLYAKASEYVKAGADRIAHLAAADVLKDVADACGSICCAPVLAFDSARSLRKELVFPEYKAGRGSQKKTAHQEAALAAKPEAVRLLKSVYCPAYSVQWYCCNGYESDDVIASFVLGLKQEALLGGPAFDGRVVIVSNDGDLHQLVLDGVVWADAAKGVMCGAEELFRHTGVRPSDVVLAKCIGGCASDAVPGVPGCGEKTVAEVLAKRSTDVTQKKAREALRSEEGEAVLARNLRLIRLPFEGMVPLKLTPGCWPAQGVPTPAALTLDGNGVPKSYWPSFPDVRMKRPADAIPRCERKRTG